MPIVQKGVVVILQVVEHVGRVSGPPRGCGYPGASGPRNPPAGLADSILAAGRGIAWQVAHGGMALPPEVVVLQEHQVVEQATTLLVDGRLALVGGIDARQ